MARDGEKVDMKKGSKLSASASKNAVAAKVDGKLQDLGTVLSKDACVEYIDASSKQGIEILRHSAAHILADAVVKLYPKAKPTIGPVVEEGFYYDFDMQPLNPEDQRKIEKEIQKIIAANQPFERIELSPKQAKDMFKDNKYKLELIEEFGENLSAYKHGDFLDLCRGPHVPSTGYVKAIKLTKLAGAYWRGDIKNKQLQRLYGIAFPTQQQLKDHLKLIEEAEKRDHRKLGKRLDLFSVHEEGPGFTFWLPNGLILKESLLNFWRELHKKAGYLLIETPMILHRKLWEQSGHWINYKEKMYTLKIDDQDFAIKPMNCPGGILVYKEKYHSYKEFPLRVGELGFVHRHEQSGEISGLLRVRAFLQDDAHIYMTPEQLPDEIMNVVNLCLALYEPFGFQYAVELSTMPEKHIGTEEQWEMATDALKKALDKMKMDYKINEGEGAFYGPKIDFHLKDAIGRTWQCGTIQVDMALPEKFDLEYEGQDGRRHRPVMIHRALYGSIERFIGILIEQFAGKFPMWLSPDQVRIITVTDNNIEYAKKIAKQFRDAGIRISEDYKGDTVAKKIRRAQLEYANYSIVIGEQEQKNNTVNVRTRENKVLGEKKAAEFLKELQKEIESRR
ncbi:threonine--tRNA ligase [Candidatus Woesearchaeota archaeon]|nr:threonine--tRNA ligase [Candidatus Woesearchaeota archaeon]